MNSSVTETVDREDSYRTVATPEPEVEFEVMLERAHAIERAAGLAEIADR